MLEGEVHVVGDSMRGSDGAQVADHTGLGLIQDRLRHHACEGHGIKEDFTRECVTLFSRVWLTMADKKSVESFASRKSG